MAFPTETVYGLAALYNNAKAIRRIYDLKGREDKKPLAMQVASVDRLAPVVGRLDKRLLALAQFWPGPLTVIVRNKSKRGTTGVRIPDHAVALGVLKEVGKPLAVTSVNRSGEPPAVSAQKIISEFDGQIDMILDAGRCRIGKASTVVDISSKKTQILRQGSISAKRIQRVLG